MGLIKIIIFGLVIVFVLWVLILIEPILDAKSIRRDADLLILIGSGTTEVINKIIDDLQGTDTSKEDKVRIEKLREIRDAG